MDFDLENDARAGVPAEELTRRLGSVTLEPATPIVAGQYGTWTLTLTVGSYGLDEGGSVKLARRLADDSQAPQFDRPGESGYCRVTTDGAATLKVRYEPKSHIRPWKRCIVIDIVDGSLQPGDTITIVLGDRSGGGPGMRAQSFVESAHEFRILIDPTNACQLRRLPTSPVVPIVPGEPIRIFAAAPSLVTAGQPVALRFRGEDRWGNAAPLPQTPVISWEGSGTLRHDAGGQPVACTAGSGRFHLACGEIRGSSNPVEIVDHAPALSLYWGDLHAQTGFSVGTGSEEEYFRFGRDQAFLDFTGHQANDFQISPADWARLNAAIARFHADHRFVILPGYEWSGNTTAGGDRNVFFLEENPPLFRSSHWQVPDVAETALSPAHPADRLFERVREHGRAFTCAHVGGRYADISRYFDPEVCPLVEVVSCWGVFEWLLGDALKHGYVVGVMANSDGHKGRPGAEGPGAGEFGIGGGLTCVLAPGLTREEVFHALLQRRCYGTTGPRIAIDFDLGGHPMGWRGSLSAPAPLRARVAGTAPIEKLELFRNGELVETVWHPAFAREGATRRVRLLWKGARHRGRGRRIDWSGCAEVTGAVIEKAETVAFDSPADGILSQNAGEVRFRSHTTGDTDGLDLMLDRADFATLTLRTPEGEWTLNGNDPALRQPGGLLVELGDLERAVRFQRYPERLEEMPLSLEVTVPPAEGGRRAAYHLKVTQSDGHLAWTSPVYVE
ncbi:MAG TPA: DUF3604 domain-containing protein [Chthoniobacteraceae bacterium]|nr:DUF3604 domain-containing protein [Chthoniobacteraceae bacterium]